MFRFFKKKTEPQSHRTGKWGEKVAVRFLSQKKYKILGQRVRVGKKDELDIVARHGDILVFIEVKTRGRTDFGRPMDAIGRDKKKALSRAAVTYLQKLNPKPPYVRIDVIEVIGSESDETPEVRHVQNAIDIDSRYRLRW